MFARTFEEWYAFYGGEEMGITKEEAEKIWRSALKSWEATNQPESVEKLKFKIRELAKGFQFDIHGGLNYKDTMDLQIKLRELSE